jgi:hypothetical protein
MFFIIIITAKIRARVHQFVDFTKAGFNDSAIFWVDTKPITRPPVYAIMKVEQAYAVISWIRKIHGTLIAGSTDPILTLNACRIQETIRQRFEKRCLIFLDCSSKHIVNQSYI